MHRATPYQSRKAKAIAVARKADDVRRQQAVLLGLGVLGFAVLVLLGSWAM